MRPWLALMAGGVLLSYGLMVIADTDLAADLAIAFTVLGSGLWTLLHLGHGPS